LAVQWEQLIRISELSRRTGISSKLIHYYLKKGYLHPPTIKKGNQAYYDDSHLDKLLFLLQCKKNGTPLLCSAELWDGDSSSKKSLHKHKHNASGESKTRSQIIDAATHIFMHKSYHRASISEIVKAVGITKSAFYYYFKNKKDLYYSCMGKLIDAFSQKANEEINQEKNPAQRLIMRAFTFTRNTREKIIVMQMLKESLLNEDDHLKNKAIDILQHYWIDPLKQDLDSCIDKDILRPVNSEIACFAILSLLETFSYRSLMKKPYSNEDIIKCLYDITAHGLLNKD
jgi:AcrR family transcriptional regulator